VQWWQVILIFVGIPAAICAAVAGVVFLTSHPRLPDGIAAARASERRTDHPRSFGTLGDRPSLIARAAGQRLGRTTA